jgi:hypothetical protein
MPHLFRITHGIDRDILFYWKQAKMSIGELKQMAMCKWQMAMGKWDKRNEEGHNRLILIIVAHAERRLEGHK